MREADFASQIARASAAARRQAICDVLVEISGLAGNEIYQRAWKKAVVHVRRMLDAPDESVNTRPSTNQTAS